MAIFSYHYSSWKHGSKTVYTPPSDQELRVLCSWFLKSDLWDCSINTVQTWANACFQAQALANLAVSTSSLLEHCFLGYHPPKPATLSGGCPHWPQRDLCRGISSTPPGRLWVNWGTLAQAKPSRDTMWGRDKLPCQTLPKWPMCEQNKWLLLFSGEYWCSLCWTIDSKNIPINIWIWLKKH